VCTVGEVATGRDVAVFPKRPTIGVSATSRETMTTVMDDMMEGLSFK